MDIFNKGFGCVGCFVISEGLAFFFIKFVGNVFIGLGLG